MSEAKYDPFPYRDRERVCKALRRIAWGYVLIHLNLNLGTVNVLPTWLGYLLILTALPALSRQVPTAALLRPFAEVLTVWYAIAWVSDCFGGITLSGDLLWVAHLATVLGVLVAVMCLYFHFQLLTDLATVSRAYDCPQTKQLLCLRTVNTLVTTAFNFPFPWQSLQWFTFLTIGIGLVVVIWICVVLFSLRHAIAAQMEEDNGETEE